MNKRCLALLRLALCLILTFALSHCGDASSSSPLKVRVVNQFNKPLSDVTVVIGNPDGSMVEYKRVDSNGEADFQNIPFNATVTALYSCRLSVANQRVYNLKSLYDVRAEAVSIDITDCSMNVTNVKVAITDKLPDIFYREVIIGDMAYLNTTRDFNIQIPELVMQRDGSVSIAVIGYDKEGYLIGYGLVKDLAITEGMTVNIDIDEQDVGVVEFRNFNYPSNAVGYTSTIGLQRKDIAMYFFKDSGSGTVPSGVAIPFIPDFAEGYLYENILYLQTNRAQEEAFIGFLRSSADIDGQDFDFSKTPPIAKDFKIDRMVDNRFTVSWQFNDLQTTMMKISIYDESRRDRVYSYTFVLPPSRNSITLTQLPANYSDFLTTSYSSYTIKAVKDSAYNGYEDYLYGNYLYSKGSSTLPKEREYIFSSFGFGF